MAGMQTRPVRTNNNRENQYALDDCCDPHHPVASGLRTSFRWRAGPPVAGHCAHRSGGEPVERASGLTARSARRIHEINILVRYRIAWDRIAVARLLYTSHGA